MARATVNSPDRFRVGRDNLRCAPNQLTIRVFPDRVFPHESGKNHWILRAAVAIVAPAFAGYSCLTALRLLGGGRPADRSVPHPSFHAAVVVCPAGCLLKFFSNMTLTHTYEPDSQFMRLVRRESDVDLITAALEIARDGQTTLLFEPTVQRLRKSVARLTHPITQAGSDVEELKLLVRHMTEELNLRGDDECYSEPETSYLNRVLETGRGIPIALSVIYLTVANDLGIPLEPIAAPAHFLTRLPTDSGNLYVDAFDHGRIMDEDECVAWLHGLTEMPVGEIRHSLKPVDERSIVIRMLNNLKSVFGSQEHWSAAWRVQHRLSLLIPGSYRERRDLAILTLRAGRPGEAIDLIRRCLDVCPPDERPVLQQHLKMAERETPRWN